MKVYIKRKFGIDSVGEFDSTTKGIVVKKGSHLCKQFSYNYTNEKYMRIRDELIKNDILTKDVSFNSPSAAACFVLGRSANGWVEWVDKSGNKLILYR